MALFLGMVFLISLSGVAAPGPVCAVSLARGLEIPFAGTAVALGHALVEIPLVIVIVSGSATWLHHEHLRLVLGILGGGVLCWMGYGTLKQARCSIAPAALDLPSTSFLAGAVTTAANPYFFLWWATVGSVLAFKAQAFGLLGVALFLVVHLSTDFLWYSGVSFMAHKIGRTMPGGVYKGIVLLSGLLLLGFGTWFLADGTLRVISSRLA
jgi:threonine/homoserine/homoserine lactone efflux protein